MSDPRRFLDALDKAIPPAERAGMARVLLVGPGRDDPVPELLTLFPQSRLTLIELDPEVVSSLRGRLPETAPVELVSGDAANPDELPAGPYDLVLIRHPDIARQMERWQDVLKLAGHRLRLEGVLVVSTFSLPEIAFVHRVLATQNIAIVPGSPYTAVPVPLQGNDRYVLIARKTPGQPIMQSSHS